MRTARANPTRHPEDMRRTIEALHALRIGALVTIGGDDTAYAAAEVASASQGTVRVAHIPKTIDNDLPLPGGVSTFGFETARHVGTQLVRNLIFDDPEMRVKLAAAAHLTPEEFVSAFRAAATAPEGWSR